MNYPTSRGRLLETEEVISNILATVEHIFDLPEPDLEQIKQLREIRAHLFATISSDVDYTYHCIYKHILLAKRQLREVIESITTTDYTPDPVKPPETAFSTNEVIPILLAQLNTIDDILQAIRLKYYKIDKSKIEDPLCPKCLEDYLLLS